MAAGSSSPGPGEPRRGGRCGDARGRGLYPGRIAGLVVALSRDEQTAYVANGLSDDITIIDLASMAAVESIPVGRTPHSILVDD